MISLKLFTSCEYLYSPKSWLHHQNSKSKIAFTLLQLICLPIISFKHMTVFSCLLLFACTSIEIPESLKKYFCTIFIISNCFLLIGANRSRTFDINESNMRSVLQLNLSKSFSLCLPIPLLRFIIIHFTYLVLIRYLLLATRHEKIINTLLIDFVYAKNGYNTKFIFMIMMSSQFLKIIFSRVEAIKVSYRLRGVNTNKISTLKASMLAIALFVGQFSSSIYKEIHGVTLTLYSRNVKSGNANIYT